MLSIPLSIHPLVQTFLSHDYTVGTSVPLVTGSDPCISLQAKGFSEAGCLSVKGAFELNISTCITLDLPILEFFPHLTSVESAAQE